MTSAGTARLRRLERAIQREFELLSPDTVTAFSLEDEGSIGVAAELSSSLLDGVLKVDELVRALSETASDAMDLALDVVVFVDSGGLPRSNAGKRQRKVCARLWQEGRLPALAEFRSGVRVERALAATAAPQATSDTESALAGIWRDVLEASELDRMANFFALGGSSLTAADVIARAQARFGVELDAGALFEAPTLAGLAREIERRRTTAQAVLSAIPRVAREARLPLSPAQRRMRFLWQLDPQATAYNVSGALRLSGDLDVDAVKWAFAEIIARHETLRTRFPEDDGEPYQQIEASVELAFASLDLTDLPADERQNALRSSMSAEMAQPFDLARGPLSRIHLARLEPREHVLWITMHHAVSDGQSMNVLVGELAQLYRARQLGAPSPLPPLAVQYADYAAWQAARLDGQEGERQLAYWRGVLGDDHAPLELPRDRPRPKQQSAAGGRVVLDIDARLAQRARELARAHGTSTFSVLLAAFYAQLQRYTGRRDLRVGVPVANRSRREAEGLIGALVNTLVLRATVDDAVGFRDLIEQVTAAVQGAQSHHELPFERLVEALQPGRDSAYHPLFQVMFNYQRRDLRALRELPLDIDVLDVAPPVARFDLSLSVEEQESGELSAAFVYASDLFDGRRIERLASHYTALLSALVASSELPMGSIDWLPQSELDTLQFWSSGQHALADTASRRGGLVQDWVEERLRAQPEATALVYGDESMTYAELDRRSRALAHELVAHGAGPDVIVAVLLERSLELIVSLVAILRSGAAYLPLDTEYPEQRLAFLLEDSGARLVLTQRRFNAVAICSRGVRVVELDAPELVARGANGASLELPRPIGSNLAYVLYTSGTTGQPKAVASVHADLAHRLSWMQAEYSVSTHETLLQKTPLTFDVAVWEVWLPLLSGARLAIAAPGEHRDPRALARLIRRYDVSTIHFVPSLLEQFVAEPESAACPSLRRLFSGGEALSSALQHAALERFPGVRIDNRYGPTEALINASYWTLRPEERGAVPIGRAIPGSRLHVVDSSFYPTPAGVAGELLIGGVGLARGYIGKPGLTAERFVPDPFATQPGQRLYRSGDWASFRADGELDYHGRRDHQVKVRGIRVELGELEAALRALRGVRAAAAALMAGPMGEPRLVGYVVGDGTADTDEWLAQLQERLPSQLVPSRLVRLDELPLLPSGKLDRSALPAPAWQRREGEEPSSELECRVAEVWREVLGIDGVALDDEFFALGGHSLLATRLVARIRRAFAIDLPLRDLFEAPTLRAFTGRVQLALATGRALEQPPLVPVVRDQPLPLSFSQERMWFLWSLDRDSAAYNVAGAVRLGGPLDATAFEAAFMALLERHEALRTTFPQVEGVPVQLISPITSRILQHRDLGSLALPEREAELQRLAAADAQEPFDLERGPVLRALLVRMGEDQHVVVVTLHHIVAEGWAMDILAREWGALYAAFRQGQPSPLAPLPVQYADYAVWQRSWLDAGEAERQLAYWRQVLGREHPVLGLPADHPRPATRSFRGDYHRWSLDAALSERIRAFALEQGATLSMTLMAGLYALLHRYTGETDLRIGYPVANRVRPELEGLIGAFLNTQVLRCELTRQLTVGELVARVRQASLDAQSHQDVPFHRVVEAVGAPRSGAYTPVFQVMCNVQEWQFQQTRSLAGLELEFIANDARAAQFDLALDISAVDGRLECAFSYSLDLFEPATIARMASHFVRLLDAMVRSSKATLAQLPMLDAVELADTLARAAGPRGPLATAVVSEMFEAQVERYPDALAVSCDEQQLTYRALDARANQLAHWLRGRGVRADVTVGVHMQRSLDVVIAVLGIFKAGGTYLPLDAEYPQQRLQHMLEDSGASIVLTSSRQSLDAAGVEVVRLEQLQGQLDRQSTQRPGREIHPESLAYCIYTSGSTGRPKGVGNTHRGLANRTRWLQAELGLGRDDRILQKTSLSFDVSVGELLLPLVSGACLVIPPPGAERDPAALGAAIRQHGITAIDFVPPMLQAFVTSGELASCPSLRVVTVGGEALPPEVGRRFAEQHTAALYNMYGPSEASIDVAYWRCGGELTASVPIGVAMANTTLHVLDARLEPVPPLVVGELYIGGVSLARGYLGQPAATARVFVPDPFSKDGGGRLYRTGDLARRRADGVLEYVGRIDSQVKVRGYRIELGEVEARLLEQPGVLEAVALTQPIQSGLQLVAYVAGADADGALEAALREGLRTVLPAYMVPASIVVVPEIPKLPNGKLDRARLPAAVPVVTERHVEPQSELERQLAEIWCEVLGLERIGIEDNFFEIGGDSIISLQIVHRARGRGLGISPGQLLQHQTIAALARVARTQDGHGARAEDLSGPVALTPVQRHFFEEQPAPWNHYNQALLLRPRLRLDAALLQRAVVELVRHHDALRLRFQRSEAGWQQSYATPDACSGAGQLELVCARVSAEGDALAEICDAAHASLDVAQGPLHRAVLIDMPDGSQRLLLVAHHLVVDGVSWRILAEDLASVYQQLASGRSVQLPAKTTSFKAWSERLRALASSPELAAESEYWRALHEPTAELPADDVAGSTLVRHRAIAITALSAERTQLLLQRANAAYRTRVNDLLLTALARALCRWTGQESVCVELESHGREPSFEGVDLSRTVGWFTSLFPLRLTPGAVADACGVGESIQAVKEQLRALPGGGLGHGILRHLAPEPLAGALEGRPRLTFNYLGQLDRAAGASELFELSSEGSGRQQSEDGQLGNWLTVDGGVAQGQLTLAWTYSSQMYRSETVAQLAELFRAELEAVIDHAVAAPGGPTPSDFPLVRLTRGQIGSLAGAARTVQDIYPLSPLQQGILFHSSLDPDPDLYVSQIGVELSGLDVGRFAAAWRAAVARHEIFRTSFWQPDGSENWLQLVHDDVPSCVRVIDAGAEPLPSLEQLGQSERSQRFALERTPLQRVVIARGAGGSQRLVWTFHHILLDGWSAARLMEEVLRTYAGERQAPTAGRYRDYIEWLGRRDRAASERFWKERLEALGEPTLLAHHVPARAGGTGHGRWEHSLDAQRTQLLVQFTRQNRITLNTLIQGAWLLVLHCYTGQRTVALGATVAGRPRDLPASAETLGLFINTVTVIERVPAQQGALDWLRQLQEHGIAAQEHEHAALADVQRWAGRAGQPLFDTLLVFENYPVDRALRSRGGADLQIGRVTTVDRTNYPLTIEVAAGESLDIRCAYSRALFDEQRVVELCRRLEDILLQLVHAPSCALGALRWVNAGEQQQLAAWNATQASYPEAGCLHHIIESRVREQPDAVALSYGEEALSYAELDARANQLAHELRASGAGPDDLVGICMERSLEMVVGLLGILKAGAAYVPLDPEYPEERLRYMIDSSSLRWVLAHAASRSRLPEGRAQVLLLDQDWPRIALNSREPLANRTSLDNLAYCIYTSGSTGRPKGAGNSHRAIVNRLRWMQAEYRLDRQDCVLQKTPFSFDVSVWEFFWPLMTGARLVMAPPGAHRDPAALRRVIVEHGVTTIHFVPAMCQAFVHSGELRHCTSLRQVMCSGEALSPALQREFMDSHPARLHNLYGPTEAAVDVTYWECERGAEDRGVPIGRPIANVGIHLLGTAGELVPVGVVGELHIGGVGLARGYYGRPALTAERFIPDAQSGVPGARLYRTGDLARRRDDGVIEYVGRADDQIKIRGLRIELGEIAARLREHPGVRDVVVLAAPSPSGKLLVAYVVPLRAEGDLDAELRAYLGAVLPEYMVPARFCFIDALPVTANGKVDYKALPPPLWESEREYAEASSDAERALAEIWRAVLGVSRVGLNDNFFELGGDSIMSLQVVNRSRQAGWQVTPRDLFKHQTLAALSQVARRETRPELDQGPTSGDVGLTPIQSWFFERAIERRHHWNQAVLLQPTRALDSTRLEQALVRLVEHHDALRLRFQRAADGWGQRHAEVGAAPVGEPLLWVKAARHTDDLMPLVDEVQQSLDLEHGPTLRALLVRFADGAERLLLVLHHLVVDAVSWRILLEDLEGLLRGASEVRALALPGKTTSFQRWSQWLRDPAKLADARRDLDFWVSQLGAPGRDLPRDLPADAALVSDRVELSVRFADQETEQLLKQAPRAYRTQVNDLLLTALARVLVAWTGEPSISIEIESHGRDTRLTELDLSRTVGWFTSQSPVRLTPVPGSDARHVRASILAVKEQLRDVGARGLGFGILRYLGAAEERARLAALPPPRVTFNYLGQFDQTFTSEAILQPATESVGAGQTAEGPLDNWLTISGHVQGGRLSLSCTYSCAMYRDATVRELLQSYAAELRAVLAHCLEDGAGGISPSDVPLIGFDQSRLDALPIAAAQIDDVLPTSPMQQGILFHALQDSDAGSGADYVSQVRLDVEGLDVESFEHAWQSAVDRHDALRSSFYWQAEGQRPVQIVHRNVAARFDHIDLRGQALDTDALTSLAQRERAAGFDLTRPPLQRLTLVRVAEQHHHVIWTFHHAILDGWSTALVLEEVLDAYAGGRPRPAPSRLRGYAEWLHGQDRQQNERFWQEHLGRLTQPTLLVGALPRSAGGRGHGKLSLRLGAPAGAALRSFAQRERLTLNTLVQASWLLLLARYTGEGDVACGVTVAGRPAALPGAERSVGLFINTLPLIRRVSSGKPVLEFLRELQDHNLAIREHESAGLYELQNWAGQRGRALFDTILVFENYPIDQALRSRTAGSARYELVEVTETTNYPLVLVADATEGLRLELIYDREQLDEARVSSIVRHLEHLLAELPRASDRCLGSLALTDAAEAQRIVAWSPPRAGRAEWPWVHELIAARAAEAPGAVALVAGETRLSYGDLARRSSLLAARLRGAGVGPDVLVGLCMRRGIDMVVGLLAILEAGGAYVPLDPDYPRERLRFMLDDSNVKLLLAHSATLDALPETSAPVWCLDRDPPSETPPAPPCPRPRGEHLAYCIYTSGSTGKPKAVQLSHAGFSSYVRWALDAYRLAELDGSAMHSSISFDLTVTSLWLPLCAGKRVELSADAGDSLEALATLLTERDGCALLKITPSHVLALAELVRGPLSNVRIWVVGGEALTAECVRAMLKIAPQARIINEYGPTETVVGCCIHEVDPDDVARFEAFPIGAAIDDTQLYVLDASLQLAPVGVAGELCIGGGALARGYRNRPGLTAERFIPHPLGDRPGERLYRTGDLARFGADGVLEYLGRIDHQAKIRGHRIELGEIEARLCQHPSVREAVVVVRTTGASKRLVAYVAARGEAGELKEALLEHLRAELPEYMVPSQLLVLDALPLTRNGKIDRAALPREDASNRAYTAPVTAAERTLAAIWGNVLGLERVDRHDNFFELGGDSIISLQVASRAREAGLRLTPKDLFSHQTLQDLARVARSEAVPEIEQGVVRGSVALTPIQIRFFAEQHPQRNHFNQALMLRVSGTLDPAALERAARAVVEHHDALRLRFEEAAAGQWLQAHADLERERAQWDAAPLVWVRDAETDADVSRWVEAAQRSLDLAVGPTFRALLLRCAGGEQRLLLTAHHLVVDAVSWRILLEDLQLAFQSVERGEEIRLPRKTLSFQWWAAATARHAQGPELHAQLEHWLTCAAPLPGDDLPVDDPGGRALVKLAETATLRLDEALTRQLLKDSHPAYRTQVRDLLLAALARALRRWTGATSAFIELEGHGREDLFDGADVSRTVGWFTSLFPVRLAPELGSSSPELASAVQTTKEALRAIPHNGVGYGLLREAATAEVRARFERCARPRVTFNYLGQLDQSFGAGSLFQLLPGGAGPVQSEESPLGNWLSIDGGVSNAELSLVFSYSREMYRAETIAQLVDLYRKELAAIIGHCARETSGALTPSDVPLVRLTQRELDELPVRAREVEDIYPLSPLQEGILFHALYAPDSGAYVNQLSVCIDGLDVQRFAAAWQVVTERYEALRTAFVLQDGRPPLQVVYRRVPQSLRAIDLQGRGSAARLAEIARQERVMGVNLERPPLSRVLLVKTGDRQHQLIWTYHHILLDGWSTAGLIEAVLREYEGEELRPRRKQYRDYIAWLQRQDVAASERFWTEQLAELGDPTLLSPSLPAHGRGQGQGQLSMWLDPGLSDELLRMARRERLTPNTLLLGAWLLLLHRYTGQRTVTCGATVSGRPADLDGVDALLGLFINTVPVVSRLAPACALADWLRKLQEHCASAREHEHAPLYQIQSWSGSAGRALFDSIVVFENYPVDEVLRARKSSSLSFGPVERAETTSYPLAIGVNAAERIQLEYGYGREFFSDEQVAHLHEHLCQLLGAFVRSPSAALGRLEMLPAEERLGLFASWHAQGSWQAVDCLRDLVQRHVGPRRDALAVRDESLSLSYGELARRANLLGTALRERGVGPEVIVGIHLERSPSTLLAMLGVLNAGGAFLPLDPQYPAERLATMLQDSSVGLLITQPGLAPLAGFSGARLELADVDWERDVTFQPAPDVTDDNLAYVLYTSGSSGRPKGVAVSRGSLSMHLQAIQSIYRLTPDDVVLHMAAMGFDAAIEQAFVPLLAGAGLVIGMPHRWTTEELCAVVSKEQVSLIYPPTSRTVGLASYARSTGKKLGIRRVCVGGEAVSGEELELIRDVFGCELINGYGPTETVITPLLWVASPLGERSGGYAPIGRAVGERTAYVLDRDLQVVPAGVVGQLYIGGTGTARGYLGQPGATAKSFIPDPFGAAGGRLYATGDLVRSLGDGTMEFVGRIDHQVKIRGYRIELGEIEARLLQERDVRETVVVAVDSPTGKQLVAYVALAAGAELSSEALRGRLRQTLPDYMVPMHIMLLDALPRTTNGKLDRRSLPRPIRAQSAHVKPTSELGRLLASVWCELLRVDEVGLTDNFFELGGHSILATQVVSRISSLLGVRVPLEALFGTATFGDFVQAIEARSGQSATAAQ